MSEVFSDYVRALDPAGEPPDAESFEDVWATLGRVLVSELKKRGLWHRPPSYLGIYGHESWRSPPAGREAPDADALEELLAGCYSHIFVRRLGGLKAQLKVKPNVEGLVFLAVRNFLHDTQKRHDPLGFRIFDVAQRAVAEALDDGELVLLSGDRRIRNDTVLGFDAVADAVADADADRRAADALEGAVGRWNDVLLPDLVTARGKALERVVGLLRGQLARLPAAGVRAFAFRQLIEPLKNDARARWCALLEADEAPPAIESDGELPALVRRIQPDTGVEDRDSFDKLTACLTETLERVDEPVRTRTYLSALWQYLRAFAVGSGGGMPSGRKLARHLGIPRDRLPGLFETLGRMVEACRAAKIAEPPVNSLTEGRAPSTTLDPPTPRRAS